jgi:hypothetical protein
MLEIGKEGSFSALGKSWRMGRLEVSTIKAFGDYCRDKVGDPYAALSRFIDKLPADVACARLREADLVAEDLRYFSLQTATAKRVQATEEGMARLFYLVLRDSNPGMTEALAWQILMDEGVQRELQEAAAAAEAKAREKAEREGKSPAPAA